MSREFEATQHIQNVFTGSEVKLLGSDGSVLPGILGVAGVSELLKPGVEIGVDRIIMQSGSEFALHTHPGAHILYVLRSHGFIHVDGVDYEMAQGDTVYVPARFAHGVKTNPKAREAFEILAFGVPHMPIDSEHRMEFVD
ncbi:cupin domain-containing protein [Nonomuraea sp. B5E05]|uniref:cupin domain-containing protein n=1 Tax=Nonomuraea sp. B5E05 TaxID=3153569 RepID=UPI0032617942